MIFGEGFGPRGGVLTRLTRDLTADAREGRLPPVRARDAEIARVMDILLRQGKCNPALVGPAGVGKTAIAEGVAQRIAAGDVPLSLRNVRLLALDHVSLLAGTTYRGQYEERIRDLIEETTAAGDVVLFVDELHNLIGQGTAIGVAMDAANMLKPALVRGDFRVIGATTDDEYDRWIRADPALERRFQRVDVGELSTDATREVLRSRRDLLERHHHVAISDESIDAAVLLTDLFPAGRLRPDRAIDALDEACASLHASTQYGPELERLIRETVAARRGAPVAEQPVDPAPRASAELEAEVSLEELAQRGISALERFSARMEAAFGAPQPASSPPPSARAPETRAPSPSSSVLEEELRRRLIESGIVVRGHDVARTVSRIAGRTVQWNP
ncbi:MAG TPA: AAA family ATPase [Gemmatimonadaceae bacterium]|nr:AAA family ATPase [Gemmatimonadaceae bacterium]